MGAAVMAGAAVVSAGASAFGALRRPRQPNIPPPPPPASYFQHDEQGNLVSSQVWDPQRNAYVTRTHQRPEPLPGSPEYEEWRADREHQRQQREQLRKEAVIKNELRQKILGNLNQPPADRVRAYEEYGKTFADVMRRDVDDRYQRLVRTAEESLEARGMTGSRAAVDLMAEYMKEKTQADIDISQRAALAREELAARDRTYWANLLQQVESPSQRLERMAEQDRAGTLLDLERARGASDIATRGTSALMARYAAEQQPQLMRWQAEMDRQGALTGAFGGLAGGLAQAYMFRQGKNISPPPPPRQQSNIWLTPNRPKAARDIFLDVNRPFLFRR